VAKVIVITGASSGVGLSLSRKYVSKGWVTIGIARSKEKLQDVKNGLGESFHFFQADVREFSDIMKVFKEIDKQWGKIDVLVNNAAVFQMSSFLTCSREDIDQMIDTNLKGTMFCTLEALKVMRKNKYARIINITSVAATHGIKDQAIYCASKYGVNGFAEALNQEVISDGITISTICPGGIDTPLWNDENNPYPGEPGEILAPEDIVDVVEFISDLPKRVLLKNVTMFPTNEWH
jgi:NADP-dependent 3-hydroxy acid dehydrogenase YdfG